jgi:hypothetical protein
MTPALPTFVLGLLIGYLGQRSRLCFVSGYRDFFLMRDAYLLKGVLGTSIGALAGYVLFRQLGGAVPHFPLLLLRADFSAKVDWIRIIAGGLGIGFVGALVGGCPFRMHVQAAEGKRSCWFYLVGFYAALFLFEAFPLRRLISALFHMRLD